MEKINMKIGVAKVVSLTGSLETGFAAQLGQGDIPLKEVYPQTANNASPAELPSMVACRQLMSCQLGCLQPSLR